MLEKLEKADTPDPASSDSAKTVIGILGKGVMLNKNEGSLVSSTDEAIGKIDLMEQQQQNKIFFSNRILKTETSF